MSGTPLQVLKAAEQAEKIYQEQIDAINATGSTGENPTGDLSPTGEPAPGSTADIEDENTPEKLLEKERHRYDVLQGKYNKEVPDLATRLAEAVGEIRALKDQVSTLSGAVKTGATASPGPKVGLLDSMDDPNVKYLKEEYPEVYKGISVALEKAVEASTSKISALEASVKETKDRTVKSDKERFYEELDKVKDWRVVNKSEEFNDWLDESEPLTGFKRRDILAEAYASMDSTRAKHFFSEFSAKNAKPVANAEEGARHEQAVVEESIAPGNAKPRQPKDKSNLTANFIKSSDIKRFYEDVRRGLYKGKEAERDKKMAEYDKAVSEYRVLVGQ